MKGMGIDYNELMRNLDNCLGLEKASTESASVKITNKVNSATEGYDDIEKEIAMEMGLPIKDSLPAEEGANEGDRYSLGDSREFIITSTYGDEIELSELLPEPDETGNEYGEIISINTNEFEEKLKSGEYRRIGGNKKSTAEEATIDTPTEDDLVFEEDSENQVEELDKKEVFKTTLANFFSELCEEMGEEEAKVTLGNIVGEVIESEESHEETEETVQEEEVATEGSLTDRLIALGKKEALESENIDVAKENQESVGDTKDDRLDDEDAAFEAQSAKMLSRYSALADKSIRAGSATEGQGEIEVSIDEEALRRTSCEFAYSSSHLRKMVTEAVKKGVI